MIKQIQIWSDEFVLESRRIDREEFDTAAKIFTAQKIDAADYFLLQPVNKKQQRQEIMDGEIVQ